MSYKASLIISIYNNIPFLKAVLDSLAYQTEKNFEIIISEDAEHPEVAEFIRSYKFQNDWQHLTQPDEGWRKEKALNNAIRKAKSDWLIFIDGDCVLHPRFVEAHVQMSAENRILAGNRVKLNKELSQNLIDNPSDVLFMTSRLTKHLFCTKGVRHIEDGFYFSPQGCLGWMLQMRTINGLIGSNMSFSRKAIEEINGFDEDFLFPAIGEDADMTWRFKTAGFEFCSLRNTAVQYHLWHKVNWVDQSANVVLMDAKKCRNEFVCQNGLKKIDVEREKPLVSVVVPVYNMKLYLEETLTSILASNYPNMEVILMDDGSKDNSWEIMQRYAAQYPNVNAYKQENGGVCSARNHAILLAKGAYILPVDADNRISKEFVQLAVAELEKNTDVKVVCSRAEFFGDRIGEWKQPHFSLKLLARKNMIDTCAMYRKSDWERVGGYCEEVVAREDWAFWIAVLKDGGKVVRLPQVGLYYRIRATSKRVTDRTLKKHVIDVLNKKHPEFFERELGGPLRYQRSWSRFINRLEHLIYPRRTFINPEFEDLTYFVKALPRIFEQSGRIIYKGRNELKEFERNNKTFIVKSYRVPHFINRIIYNTFRASKARRSYRYAEMLRKLGIGSPEPVGFYSTGTWFLFGRSYFVCLKSDCPYTYRDFANRTFEHCDEILRAIARTTACLHEHGILHKDYSAGNILFKETPEGIHVEIIDLNRMRFGRVSMEEGCKNFERLPGTHNMFVVLAEEYAKVRGFDPKKCLELIEKAH